MKNKSENSVSIINESVFYQEFTFDKNEFIINDGETKELADNVILLDEIKIIIQIKERDQLATGNANKWYQNKIINKAKNQIKDTVSYFEKIETVTIKNRKNQEIKIEKVKRENLQKIIIYDINEGLSERNRKRKFYKSKDVGNIHIFSLKDYYWICKYLLTPAELNEYLIFREKFYNLHKEITNELDEQYLLSHFIETDTDFTIKKEYALTLEKYEEDISKFDIYELINYFSKKFNKKNISEINYHQLFKEICKLKRTELSLFKERYNRSMDAVKANQDDFSRFAIGRTNCGFVFLSLTSFNVLDNNKNYLLRFTELYKYKHKLQKCVGIIFFKSSNSININFCYYDNKWEYDSFLQELVDKEEKISGSSKVIKPRRYKLK